MNKQELIGAVAVGAGISKSKAGKTVHAMPDLVVGEVSRGEVVQLIGFGAFSQRKRAARTGRNPTTGAEIVIAAANTVKFTDGKAFKDAVSAS